MNILWDTDPAASDRYRMALGADARQLASIALVGRAVQDEEVSQVVIGPDVDLRQACNLAEGVRVDRPGLGVILLRHRLDVTAMAQALRSGIREVVAADDQTSLADAVRRSRELSAKLAGHVTNGAGSEGKVITVFSAKGGVGKTTLSTNLATYLASTGLRTLLIDLDLAFGDVAISLQLLPASSVHDAVAMSGHLDEQGLKSLVTRHEGSGLDVLAAPANPADADRIPVDVVTELIRVSRASYDFIVIDTPPSFTESVLAACDVSNLLVLIATLDIPAVKNLRIALDTLDMLGNPRDSRVVVLNRADAKVGLRADDVVNAIKQPIALSIPNSINVPASINRGVTIVLDEPRHPVSAAIRELGDVQVRQRFHAPVEQTEVRRGRILFGAGRR